MLNIFRKSNILLVFKPRFYSSHSTTKLHENPHDKVLKVAVIGLPNAGKSTLINSILDKKVCPVSQKVHTTQSHSQSIINKFHSQIIIFDTPGIVSEQERKKHSLDKEFTSACRHSIEQSDVIAVLHDISNRWTRNALHPLILELLSEYHTVPSLLVLNKIDRVRSKRVLLEVIRSLTCNNISLDPQFMKFVKKNRIQDDQMKIHKDQVGWPLFKDVFLVSSLKGDGVDRIVDYFSSISMPKPWEFKNNEFTDQEPEKLIEQFVRSRLLDYLPQEIPYNLICELEYFSNDNNKIFASVNIICPNERHEKLVCGALDGKLRQITDRVTSDLIECFRQPVTLTICTTVDKKKNKD
ncbi:GTPase Era, mitochondrial [Chironomus tepperi]|uniref:GTPase Era, mitochondrial n=1 Tax=Chironomus tepperi TaxID=113505 RepID=UPI00391EED56